MNFLVQLLVILFLSTIVSHFFNKFSIPAVLGVLLLGIILGPGITGIIKPTHSIDTFAEIGVILLMFIAGIESDLGLLKKYFKPSIIVATLGVVLPLISIFIFDYYFGFPLKENLFISVVFAATSVSISVEVLKSLNYLSGVAGTTILGAAIVDDVIAIFLLSVMSSTLTGKIDILNLLKMIVIWILFFIFSYFAIKKFVPYINKVSKSLIAPRSEIITALCVCFSMAYLADFVKLDAVLGAFIAGVAYSEIIDKEKINSSIQTIGYSIFIPVFFISVGLNISFATITKDLFLIISLTIIGILGKLIGSGVGAKLSGFSNDDSFIIGAGMISRGEMALIIAQIGFGLHLMSQEYYSAIIFTIILITLIAPIILKYSIIRKSNSKKM